MMKKNLHRTRHSRYALMIAAALQWGTTSAYAESITVGDGETVTENKEELSSLTVEANGSFTNDRSLRLRGDFDSIISGTATIQGNRALSLEDGAKLTLNQTNVFGTSNAPTLELSDTNIADDRPTQLIIAADTLLKRSDGFGLIIAEDNSDIEIKAGKTLTAEGGGVNIRGSLSGAGEFRLIDLPGTNFIDPKDDVQSNHTGDVFIENTRLNLRTGALANSTNVTFKDNQKRQNGDSLGLTTIDADALKNGVNLTVTDDSLLKLDGNNKPTITHTAIDLTLSADSELQLDNEAKLRSQNANIEGDISGAGTLIFHGGQSSTIKTTGTTFTGITQVTDRSTLDLEVTGALGGSDTLSLANGATVNARANNVFNSQMKVEFQTGENRLDIRGPQTIGNLELSENSTVAFTSSSSGGGDELILKSTSEESVIDGQFTLAEAGGKVTLDGSTAKLNAQQPTNITFEVENNGHLIINHTNAVQGSLVLDSSGAKVTVNAENGLNATTTNSTLRLQDNAEVVFNADQALDKLSTAVTSKITVADGNTLSIANTTSPGTESLFYGTLSGAGNVDLTAGELWLGNGGPANSHSGAFTVSGGSTLIVNKSTAISGNNLTVSGGSIVDVRNGDGALNDGLDVALIGAGDQLMIDTFSTHTQRVDSLNAGAGSEVEITVSTGGGTPNSLVIGADNGNSQIDGRVFGDGNLTIAGSGKTTVNRALEINGSLEILDTATIELTVNQTLSNKLMGGGSLVVTGASELTLNRASGNTDFNGTVKLEDTAKLIIATNNALGTATLSGGSGNTLQIDAEQDFAGGLSFNGSVSGTGTIVFSSDSEHSVPDNLSGFSGTLEIQSGSLTLNSGLGTTGASADLTIADGAELAGTGTVTGAATLADGATHAPGNSVGTQTVGSYTLADGATLEVELDADSDGALINDLVRYTASATLGDNDGDSDGPTITVSTLNAGLYIADGETLTVIEGDGVTNLTVNDPATISVTETLNLLTLTGAAGIAADGTEGDYVLSASRTDYAAVNTNGLNAIQRSVAQALDDVADNTPSGAGSATQSLLVSLDALGQAVVDGDAGAAAEYQDALDQLSGTQLLSADAAWFKGAQRWSESINQAILRGRDTDAAQPLHVQVYGRSAETDNAPERPGFETDTYGLVLTTDRRVSARSYLGGALGYEQASADFRRYGSSSDSDTANAAVRYAFEPRGDIRFSTTATAGYGDIETTRPIAFSGTAANSNSDAWHAGLHLSGEHTFHATEKRRITAYAGAGYVTAERSGFNETGNAGVVLRDIQDRRMDSLSVQLGMHITDTVQLGSTMISPDLGLFWIHEFSAEEDPLQGKLGTANSSGVSALSLVDADRDADRLRINAGLNAQVSKKVSVRLGYNGEYSESSTAHQASAALLIKF